MVPKTSFLMLQTQQLFPKGTTWLCKEPNTKDGCTPEMILASFLRQKVRINTSRAPVLKTCDALISHQNN